jgi:hypothetical protein
MAKTVISHANELVAEHGKEYAIAEFQKLIDELGEPKDFGELCKLSGYETAIEHIKGNIK